jgi:hypothetical protein
VEDALIHQLQYFLLALRYGNNFCFQYGQGAEKERDDQSLQIRGSASASLSGPCRLLGRLGMLGI